MRIWMLLIAAVCTSGHAATPFIFSETAGPFAVGFKVVEQYDATRTFLGRVDAVTGIPTTGDRARPMQTLIWYPAVNSGARLRYGEYLHLTGSEDRFDRSAEEVSKVADFRLQDFLSPDIAPAAILEIKNHAMRATRDGAPLSGKFPVVIYAPSHNASAAENADLCEYLASHGYIVVASPSMGASGRWMGEELADVETQVADIEFLVGYAAKLPDADGSNIAVIGYSWGGISNVFAAAKDNRITALVGFDGGIRLVGKLVAAAKYVTPERINIPYLYLASNSGSFEDLYRQKQDLSDDLLARLKYADLYLITLNPLVHYHFASEHLRFLPTSDPAVSAGEYSVEEIYRAYGWVARYSLAFLDATLKGDGRAMAYVTNSPAGNGFPPHTVKADISRRSGLPPTRESIAAEAHRLGFAHVGEIYEGLRKENSEFKLSPSDFADWIDDLVSIHRIEDALNIGKLFAKTYPDRPGPWERLGGLDLLHGDKGVATADYKKALSIDPTNARVQRKLKQLGGTE